MGSVNPLARTWHNKPLLEYCNDPHCVLYMYSKPKHYAKLCSNIIGGKNTMKNN